MKKIILILVLLFGLTFAQDVKIPENLLEPETTTDVEYETSEETTEENLPPEEIPPQLVDVRHPDVIQPKCPYQSNPCLYPTYHQRPCDVVAPSTEVIRPCSTPTRPPPVYDEPQPPHTINHTIISPNINTTVEIADTEEIRQCPIGLINNGTSCVELYWNDCPDGYEWREERCVLSQVTCPLNFVKEGNTCVQQKICPPNYILNNGRCVQPIPECPMGWTWNGESCEVINIQCQAGSVLQGRDCVIESITCPNGSILVGANCVKPSASCPTDFDFDASSGFCIQVNRKCKSGSVLYENECRTTTITCPQGSQMIDHKCFQTVTSSPPTRRPTTRSPIPPTRKPNTFCPPGYTFYRNLCYRCPPGYNFCDSKCLKGKDCNSTETPLDQPPTGECPNPINCPSQPPTGGCPPTNPHYPNCQYPNPPSRDFPYHINVNLITRGLPGIDRPSNGKGYNIVNNVEPIVNTIHNINNVTHPITLNNVNTNNIYIYTDTQCPDGSITTVVVKNNETINGCVDVIGNRTESKEVEEEDEDRSKCCEVVTPRQCKERRVDSWQCSHKRYKYCGKFCIADRLYLKPSVTTYQNQVLTIAPSHNSPSMPCFGRNCPPVDCSGCIDGSFNCSSQCYTYPCNHAGCHYLSQTEFCTIVGGQICE